MNKVVKVQVLRYVTASRKRPDLDIQILVRIFKFSLIPKALLTPDGKSFHITNKHLFKTGKLGFKDWEIVFLWVANM